MLFYLHYRIRSSRDGIFALTVDVQRPLPTQSNDPITHEFVHESVLKNSNCPSEVKALVGRYPELVCPLGGIETAARDLWPYDDKTNRVQEYLHDVKIRTGSNWLEKLINISMSRDQIDSTADTSTKSTAVVVTEQFAEITVSRSF